MKINAKKLLLLAVPIIMFFILVVPYKYANQELIVDWLGCGCPQLDETGNMIENNFNANDFTRVFWAAISVIATSLAVFLSKTIPSEKRWLRIAYVIFVFVSAISISYMFCQSMLWC